jgi:hypothetical protein
MRKMVALILPLFFFVWLMLKGIASEGLGIIDEPFTAFEGAVMIVMAMLLLAGEGRG